MKGIDVSKHNGVINWEAVKNDGVEFVIMRSSYGNSTKDTQFEANYLGAKKVGLPVGVYHYLYATTAQGALAEAKFFEKCISHKPIDLPVFLDIEEESIFKTGRANEIVEAFCSYLESKGYFVGVYCSKYYFNVYLKNITSRYAGWVAQWSSECTFSQPHLIWQKSNKGRIAGISGNVDLDEADPDALENVQFCIHSRGLNGYGDTETESEPAPVETKSKHLQIYIDNVCILDKYI